MNIDLKRLKIDMKAHHFCYKSGTRNLQIRSQSRYGYTLRRLLQNNNKKMANTTRQSNDKREELRNLTSQCQNMTSGGRKSSATKQRRKPKAKKFEKTKIGPKSYLERVRIAKFCAIAKRTRMASGIFQRESMRLRIRGSKNSQKTENHLLINRTVELTQNLDFGSEKSKLLFLCSLDLIPSKSALKQPLVLVKPLPETQAKKLLLKRQREIDEGKFSIDNSKRRVISNFAKFIGDDNDDDDIIIEKFVRNDIGIALERVNNSDFKLIRCNKNIGNVLRPPIQSQPKPKYLELPSSKLHSSSPYSSRDPALQIKCYTTPMSMAQSKSPMMRLYPPQQQQQRQQHQHQQMQQKYLQVQKFPRLGLVNQQQQQRSPPMPIPMVSKFVRNNSMNMKTATVKPMQMGNSRPPRPRSSATLNTVDDDDDDVLIIEKVRQKSYRVFPLDKFLESERLLKSRQLTRDPFVNIDALKDTLKELNTEVTML